MVDTDDTHNVRRTPDDERRTTPLVWHKLPTGELKRQTSQLKQDADIRETKSNEIKGLFVITG